MAPVEQTTWLVVTDEIGDSLYVRAASRERRMPS
jgi:hypothetical protein